MLPEVATCWQHADTEELGRRRIGLRLTNLFNCGSGRFVLHRNKKDCTYRQQVERFWKAWAILLPTNDSYSARAR